MKRVAVLLRRVRPYSSPNAPGLLARLGPDDCSLDLGLAAVGVQLGSDEFFACVVPGESGEIWYESYRGVLGFGDLGEESGLVGFT